MSRRPPASRGPSALLAALVVPLLLAPACVGHPGHPVLGRQAGSPVPNAATQAPEPGPLSLAGARAALFADYADVAAPLAWLRAHPVAPSARPRLTVLGPMERAARRRYARGGPLGPVRSVAAFGFSAWFPLPPRAVADLVLDPEVERSALGADAFAPTGRAVHAPDLTADRYRVEMLRRGQGPFRFDFRVTVRILRFDLPDGTVLLRHGTESVPPAQNLTLYQGATVVEPSGTGSWVTEFLVIGTSVVVPFFLEPTLRAESIQLFENRATGLWE